MQQRKQLPNGSKGLLLQWLDGSDVTDQLFAFGNPSVFFGHRSTRGSLGMSRRCSKFQSLTAFWLFGRPKFFRDPRSKARMVDVKLASISISYGAIGFCCQEVHPNATAEASAGDLRGEGPARPKVNSPLRNDTVDEPVDMSFIPLFIGFHTSQVVGWDF